ncbi:MAG: transcriptional repressor [Thermotogae bacterium]|jgi:Fe2+ or Zn2+ uptake regulation protein|nr:transcriptional repressor [Thermotogota bacterium]MCL5032436.1 transcriptional repressor [Thermotogota bacterium]
MKDEMVGMVSEKLHQKGMRMTGPRKEALEFFILEHHLLTPQELFEDISKRGVKVGLTTVYRMMNSLMEMNLARNYSIEGELRYIFCPPYHHHHLICLKCLKVEDVFDCPVKNFKIEGFKVQSHQLDFFGICEDCQKSKG